MFKWVRLPQRHSAAARVFGATHTIGTQAYRPAQGSSILQSDPAFRRSGPFTRSAARTANFRAGCIERLQIRPRRPFPRRADKTKAISRSRRHGPCRHFITLIDGHRWSGVLKFPGMAWIETPSGVARFRRCRKGRPRSLPGRTKVKPVGNREMREAP